MMNCQHLVSDSLVSDSWLDEEFHMILYLLITFKLQR